MMLCMFIFSFSLGGVLFSMPSLHLFISSDHVSSLFLAHYSYKILFLFNSLLFSSKYWNTW